MSALEDLVRAAMASGIACYTDKVRAGEVDSTAPLTSVFGDFPAEFLRIRTDLVDAVRDEFRGDTDE